MTPSPSTRIETPGLDELLPTTRLPSLDPSVPVPPASPRATSSSWDLKPGRWIKALPASYRTRKPRPRFAEWARDERAVANTIGLMCAAVGLALVIAALGYGATSLSREAVAGTAPSATIALVLGRVAVALLAVVSGHTMMKYAERLLRK